jgi:(p)ppGpp synthase/HD superfamily hydrolase
MGNSIQDALEYRRIAEHYEMRATRRSGMPLMGHIDEGLAILRAIGATEAAMCAFCLHPLLQADADLAANYPRIDQLSDDPHVIALALEYRHIANATLSTREIANAQAIVLSPLREVNDMLVADKVQNRRDFLQHHASTHPRAAELARYFELWLVRLGIDERRYDELVAAAEAIVRGCAR